MTIEALGFVSKCLDEIGVKYEFAEWSDSTIPPIYFVGEYISAQPMGTDGMQQTMFLLTGTGRCSWVELLEQEERIEQCFPSVGGRIGHLDNGSTVAIFFDTSMYVPTETEDLKRVQINLTIKEWRVV